LNLIFTPTCYLVCQFDPAVLPLVAHNSNLLT
jgi:hypothetical protein